MADRLTETTIKLCAVQDHLFRMHRFDRVERDRKVTCVLDVDNKFRPAVRCYLADRTEFLATVGNERLESYFDLLWHDLLPLPPIYSRLSRIHLFKAAPN